MGTKIHKHRTLASKLEKLGKNGVEHEFFKRKQLKSSRKGKKQINTGKKRTVQHNTVCKKEKWVKKIVQRHAENRWNKKKRSQKQKNHNKSTRMYDGG